jgi:serpin B
MHRSHLDFALALHARLTSEGNLIWSPYSVASALGLAAVGARGATRDELAQTLAPGTDLDELGRMLADSASVGDAEAAVANSLWMRLGLTFSDTYRQTVLGWPGGALHTADFAGDPEGSRAEINADVEKTTRGLIKELLAQGMIHKYMAAVIVNALYLKVAWRNTFVEEATRPAAFHAPSGIREVATMRQQERMGYAAAGGWRMVTLPTVADVAVDVLLSDGDLLGDGGQLTDGGQRLTPQTLLALYDSSAPTTVELTLPRFRVEARAALKEALKQLGVRTAFTELADFSGITPDDRVFIENVVHKAVLRVDEKGFEGAAATAVLMRLTSLRLDSPVPFHVDRPFLVVVRHVRTGAIYFLARVVEP